MMLTFDLVDFDVIQHLALTHFSSLQKGLLKFRLGICNKISLNSVPLRTFQFYFISFFFSFYILNFKIMLLIEFFPYGLFLDYFPIV
jgi:hypothetical protein